MVSMETCLRRITRRIAFVRGGARLIEPLRRYYVKRYESRPERFTVLDDFDGDMRLRVDRASYMGSLIYWRGYHSYRELRCLDRLLTPSMVFADVGANRGEFTIFAAKRLPHGKVLSFEPLEECYQELLANARLNKLANILPFACGLADRAESCSLYTSTDVSVHGSWHEGLATLYPTDDRAELVGTATLRRFDDVFRESNLSSLHCMKIDVEGAELAVLRGASDCLERFRPVLLLEMNAETFQAAGSTNREIADLLTPLGYRLHVIDRCGSARPDSIDQLPNFCCTLWAPTSGSSCSPQDLQRVLTA